MNPRWLNHFRGLAPIAAVGIALLAGCLLLKGDARMMTATWIYALICLMTGVSGFGLDMVYNTHLPMLTQPIARRTLWGEKVVATSCVLGVLAIVYLALLLCWEPSFLVPPDSHYALMLVATLAPLLALGGGSALTLLLRQVQGAFWLLAFSTLALLILIHSFWPPAFSAWELVGYLCVFGALSVVGLAWGRRMFLNYQDYSPVGSEVSFSWRAKESRTGSGAAVSRKGGSAVLSLVRKELGLQQINFILFVAALGIGALIPSSEEGGAAFLIMKDFVCIAAPFMIGAVAVAEERRMGVSAWHITLPPSRLKQWLVKLTVCISLSLALGLALREIPRWLAPELQVRGLLGSLSMLKFGGVVVFGTLMGLLASSSARHYFQALAILSVYVFVLSILDSVAVWWVIPQIGHVPPTNLFRLVGCILLAGYGLLRAYRNFVSIEGPGKLVIRTLIGVVACVVVTFLLTGFLYNRTWELFERNALRSQTFEKEGAQEILTGILAGVSLDPQGRLWRSPRLLTLPDGTEKAVGFREMPELEQIGSDADWKQVVVGGRFGFGALKTDGTLWAQGFDTQDKYLRSYRTNNLGIIEFPRELTQITPGHRWTKFQQNRSRWLGLKEDGTLWIWGGNAHGGFGLEDHSLVWPEPRQVGTDDDWADLLSGYRTNVARKKDGSHWRWGWWYRSNPGGGKVTQIHRAELERVKELSPFEIVDSRYYGKSILGRLKDGRIVVAPLFPGADSYISGFTMPLPEDLQANAGEGVSLLRPEIDWDTISLWRKTLAITHDRRLVSFAYNMRPKEEGFRYVEMGGNWSAFVSAWKSMEHVGVKEDGSLWKWRVIENRGYYSSGVLYGAMVAAEQKKLIPGRFRPKRLGFLELGR